MAVLELDVSRQLLASQNHRLAMRGLSLALLFACFSCCSVRQPDSARTVQAIEVPLPTAFERRELLALLDQEAQTVGYHVDAATYEENEISSEFAPKTIHAAIWRGENDEEPVAVVLDGPDHLGLAWLTFSISEQPKRTRTFRDRAIRRILSRWPNAHYLPVLPNGVVPLHEDLVLTSNGYRIKREAAVRYGLSVSPGG